jgi:hypothetical protein
MANLLQARGSEHSFSSLRDPVEGKCPLGGILTRRHAFVNPPVELHLMLAGSAVAFVIYFALSWLRAVFGF